PPLRGAPRDRQLGLRAHRQPDKSTLRLGTLSCLQHFFPVLLDQRFAIDPHLPSFLISRFSKLLLLRPARRANRKNLRSCQRTSMFLLSLKITSIENHAL